MYKRQVLYNQCHYFFRHTMYSIKVKFSNLLIKTGKLMNFINVRFVYIQLSNHLCQRVHAVHNKTQPTNTLTVVTTRTVTNQSLQQNVCIIGRYYIILMAGHKKFPAFSVAYGTVRGRQPGSTNLGGNSRHQHHFSSATATCMHIYRIRLCTMR